MKKIKSLMLMALIAIMACTISAFAISASAESSEAPAFLDSMIANGNFEGEFALGDVNSNGSYYTENGRTAVVDTDAHTGEKSIKVEVGGCTDSYNGTFGYRLADVPVYEITHTNNGRTFIITAYLKASLETQWLGMFVHMIGWDGATYVELGEYAFAGNNWNSSANGWIKFQMQMNITKGDKLYVQTDGATAINELAAADVAAFKVYVRSWSAESTPAEYHIDDLSTKFATGVTFSDEKAIEKGGDFEGDAVYGSDFVSGAWRQSGTVLSNSADIALSGDKSLKVSGGQDAIYRFTDLNSYNMRVYSESTYTVSASIFAIGNVENTAVWKGMILNVVTIKDGAYTDHYYNFAANNWAASATWTNFDITFHIINTATGIEIAVGDEVIQVVCDNVAAVDVLTRCYNAENGVCDYYVDCFSVTRKNVLFGNPADGVAGEIVSVEMNDGENVLEKLALISIPTKEGWEFEKWVDEDGDDISADLTMNGEDIFVYAQYKKTQFTLNFDANTEDVIGEVAAQTVEYGTEVTLTDGFEREGYVFVGWATEASGYALFEAGDKFVVTENVTLYAVWEEVEDVDPEESTNESVETNESESLVTGESNSENTDASQPESKSEDAQVSGCMGSISGASLMLSAICGLAVIAIRSKKQR